MLYRKTLAMFQRMHTLHPDDERMARNMAIGKSNIGYALLRIGDSHQAAKELHSAINMVSGSIAKDPGNMQVRSTQFFANVYLSLALLNQGDVPGSIDAAQAALAGFDGLPEGMRLRTPERRNWGEAHYYLGQALERRAAGPGRSTAQVSADLQAACMHFHRSVDIVQDLKDRSQLNPGEFQPDTARRAMQRCPPSHRVAPPQAGQSAPAALMKE